MKQVIQHIKTGKTNLVDVPVPNLLPGNLLVRTTNSLVSAGTERMVVDFARKNLLQKARSRPEQVKKVLDKARREGVLSSWEAVSNRLDQPIALGYSCSGTVIDFGSDIHDFHPEDRVACAGGGYACHSEVVCVPENLVVKLPDAVGFESAAFTTLGAIALQGIRLTEAKLGEKVAIIGLGLLGQLAVQILKAAGCMVTGMDLQPERAKLALQLGIDAVATEVDEFENLCMQSSSGYGVDAVLITAATQSNQPVEVAGQIARKKGIVVAVGAIGMNIPRKVYYQKELDFRISTSYGPGRYDPEYEEKGHDYPYAYVRWTEHRNMQAFVQLLVEEKVNTQPLVTHRFPIDDAPKAYDLIAGETSEHSLGIILTYSGTSDLERSVSLRQTNIASLQKMQTLVSFVKLQRIGLGVIGAGGYANGELLPALKRIKKIDLIGISSAGGLSARASGDRFGFSYCTTDTQRLLSDSSIDLVAILTRHHLHAQQVVTALQAGKHVFVEKPLCLTLDELQEIIAVYQAIQDSNSSGSSEFSFPYLMVGFNRRFAPFVTILKQHLIQIQEPLMIYYRINAGFIPSDHWTQDPKEGGGRLLGEGCHFVDILIHLAGCKVRQVTTYSLDDSGQYCQDNLTIVLEFINGSVGVISYVANGNPSFGKEYLEVFGGGLAAQMEDYRVLNIYHGRKRIKQSAKLRQDKGRRVEWQALVDYFTDNGPVPMIFEDIVHSTVVTLASHRSLQLGNSVLVDELEV